MSQNLAMISNLAKQLGERIKSNLDDVSVPIGADREG